MNPSTIVKQLLETDDDVVDVQSYVDDLPDRREVVLEVKLTFDESIHDVGQVSENVYRALKDAASRGRGLAPYEEEAATQRITISILKPELWKSHIDEPVVD